ncbi:MAG TPA: peptidase C15 [Nostocaceae cyanobacterium]|nr:peptidase C15 [Nostocaceae cyanobacterium]
MKKRILLTSFDTWLSNQLSNSSDDLLLNLDKMASRANDLFFLRRLPVDVNLASSLVIAKINEVQPDYVICCGMAASREKLSVEVMARSTNILPGDGAENVLQTTVDLKKLMAGTVEVEISHDCGMFVCEGLYYSILDYLQRSPVSIPCVFVHVPILHPGNSVGIVANFLLMVNNLALL